MRVDAFDYHLPCGLIAQRLASPRDSSRLLVVDRKQNQTTEDTFLNLDRYLRQGDVLVFNDTKVFPARLWGRRPTGGRNEVFLLKSVGTKTWEVLVGGKVRCGDMDITFGKDLRCRVQERLSGGRWLARFNKTKKEVLAIAQAIGQVPTPPYIKRRASRQEYQTVYAKKTGSVAAPTAGFHFTPRLIKKIKRAGVQLEYVTLHVGYGTFQPVKVRQVEKHRIHQEYADVSAPVLKRLRQAKKQDRRIIAVGTTTVRTLEAVFPKRASSFSGWIDAFIFPGYRFRCVDGMITNFHLPQSSLLMLVSAFAGRKQILRIYKQAVRQHYRFYSFGDGMLIQ